MNKDKLKEIGEEFYEKFAEEIDEGVFTISNDNVIEIADYLMIKVEEAYDEGAAEATMVGNKLLLVQDKITRERVIEMLEGMRDKRKHSTDDKDYIYYSALDLAIKNLKS